MAIHTEHSFICAAIPSPNPQSQDTTMAPPKNCVLQPQKPKECGGKMLVCRTANVLGEMFH